MRFRSTSIALLLLALTAPLRAQHAVADSIARARDARAQTIAERETGAAPTSDHEIDRDADIIMPHITDSHHVDYPCFKWPSMSCEKEIPRWKPVHVGPFTIDLSITKHVVMMMVAALLCILLLLGAARAHARHSHEVGRPKGFAAGVEATVLYIRNEVIMPNVGPHGGGFAPFLLTVFFFILFTNLLGLIPYGSTATGNISVTATLAIMTFIVVEIAGMRTLGRGYINTIIYWPHDQSLMMKLPMTLIMTPLEIIGKLTKPFALAIRLFANMTAGHVVVLALISMIFTFGSYWIAGAPLLMAVGIMMLELFVALLQAFIFTLLSSVFIGLIRTSHH